MTRVLARPVAVVLALVLGTFTSLLGAPQAYADTYSDDAVVFEFNGGESAGVFGWGCNVESWWVVNSDTGNVTMQMDWHCGNGGMEDDREVRAFSVSDGIGGCQLQADDQAYNIDEDDERRFQVTLHGAGVSAETCGIASEVCLETRIQNTLGWGTWSGWETVCENHDLGSPPEPEDEWYQSGDEGCAIGTPLQPWLTEPQAVAVSGGWVWRQKITGAMPGYNGAAMPLDGSSVYPYLFYSWSGLADPVSHVRSPYPDDDYMYFVRAINNYAGVSLSARVGSSNVSTGTRTVTLDGPVHTTPIGSDPVDFQIDGYGYAVVGGLGGFSGTLGTGQGPEYLTSRPTTAQNVADAFQYAQHHDPERCHFWYGTSPYSGDGSGAGTAGGPVTERDAPEPPPPGGTGSDTPPESNPEDPEDPDGSAGPQPPATDSEDACGDFKLWNPVSWVEAGFCGIVAAVVEAVKAIGKLLAAITGLVADLISGLLGLLSDLFIPSGLPDLGGFSVDLPDGWEGTFPELGDPGCGAITMPSVDFVQFSTPERDFLNTCDEPWPTVRTMTYYGTLALGLMYAANRGLRMIMEAIGIGVDVGGTVDDPRRR